MIVHTTVSRIVRLSFSDRFEVWHQIFWRQTVLYFEREIETDRQTDTLMDKLTGREQKMKFKETKSKIKKKKKKTKKKKKKTKQNKTKN